MLRLGDVEDIKGNTIAQQQTVSKEKFQRELRLMQNCLK